MNLAELVYSPAAFREHLLIDTDSGPRPLAKVADAWQIKDFEALDSAWERVARRGDRPAVNRAYLERPRGHSKTNDLAVMVAWALLASPRKLAGVAAAADKDQARLLRDSIEKLLLLNPWLAGLLEVQSYKVLNKHTGSTLEIMSADVPGSWGITPDFIVVDEIVHWTDAAEQFWVSLLSSAAKRASCLLVVISNAGVGQGTSWQWRVREAARESPDWYFSRIDGPQASWISEKILAEQRRLLPPPCFERLWLNSWVSSSGDALPEAEIKAALRLDGPPAGEVSGLVYGGLDLGLKKDHSSLAIVSREAEGDRLKLVYVKDWKAPPGGKVEVGEIERTILELNERYGLREIAFDPWAAQFLAERLENAGLRMREVPFSAKNTQAMCGSLLEAFGERRIELWEHEQLLADLRSLRIELKGNGYKLAADRNKDGHADRAFALALALMAAADGGGGRSNIRAMDLEDMSDQEMRDILGELDEDRPQRGWQSETCEAESWH